MLFRHFKNGRWLRIKSSMGENDHFKMLTVTMEILNESTQCLFVWKLCPKTKKKIAARVQLKMQGGSCDKQTTRALFDAL